ncbi:MAG: mechanosensitive ion channel family protein [Clostridia bacterium]
MNILAIIISFLTSAIVGIVIRIALILVLLKVSLVVNDKLFAKASDNLKMKGQTKYVTYLSFARHAAVAVIYFIAVIAIGQNIPGFENAATALLASTGVLTVVIGFASQEAMSSIVSGVMILTFKPFVIGDVITYNGTVGTVEEITLRHTVVKTLENKRLIVPNASMNSNVIENANFNESKVCAFLEIGISYESSIDKARAIMLDHCVAHKDYLDNRSDEEKANGAPAVVIRVIELADSSVNMRAWIWAKDGGTAFAMKCDLLESIKRDFDKNDINIPYPQLTISNK